jgi:uncharacterized protein (DUF4415 family)
MKGAYMAIVTSTLKAGAKPTPEQLEMVRRAAALPVTYDEDSPKLTDDELAEFRRVSDTTQEERKRLALKGADARRRNVTLDADVFEWLRQRGEDYHEQVNSLLRQAMLAH